MSADAQNACIFILAFLWGLAVGYVSGKPWREGVKVSILRELEQHFKEQAEADRKATEFKWKGWHLETVEGDERVPLDEDFEEILISAERYALGRRTGVVSMTIRYITALIPCLSDGTLSTILRDLNEQKRMNKSFGMDFDEAEWKQLMKAIEKELGARKDG